MVERYNYGWCHGPAGDAQVFRLLRDLSPDPDWPALADLLAHRHALRPAEPAAPGIWDNNGRCCGTAGVLALAVDRIAEQDDSPEFALLLVTDLAAHATREADGARWSDVEHRATPSELQPQPGWARVACRQ